MKKRLLFMVIFSSFCVFTGSCIALSQEATTTDKTAAQSEDSTKLKQRVEERKNRLKTRLDNNQSKNLIAKCGGAQSKLSPLLARFENSHKPYKAQYDSYLQRLENLQVRLKQKNIDTTKLEAEIAVLKQKIQALGAASDLFMQSVSDAKSIDCKSDPTGFRAALDDAKNAAIAVKAARGDLEQYARETIKATIESLKSQTKPAPEQR